MPVTFTKCSGNLGRSWILIFLDVSFWVNFERLGIVGNELVLKTLGSRKGCNNRDILRTFRSSRTFPGQLCNFMSSNASGEIYCGAGFLLSVDLGGCFFDLPKWSSSNNQKTHGDQYY